MISSILQKLNSILNKKQIEKQKQQEIDWPEPENLINKTCPFQEFEKYKQEYLHTMRTEFNFPKHYSSVNFILSTYDKETGFPNARTVNLLKSGEKSGFQFMTSNTSVKAREFQKNNKVHMLFYFIESIEVQIRIKGNIKPCTECDNDKVFQKAPRGLQILYRIVSNRLSEELKDNSRQEILQEYHNYVNSDEKNFKRAEDHIVYTIEPEEFIFFKGNTKKHGFNLSLVYKYSKQDNGQWRFSYLYP